MRKLVLALLAVVALAPGSQAEGADPTPADFSNRRSWTYSYADVGYFGGRAEQDDFAGSNSGYAIGGGYGHRINRHLAWEFDTLWAGRRYDTPPGFVYASDTMLLENAMFTLNARAIVPVWMLEPWFAFGAGLSFTMIEVQSELAPTVPVYDDSDLDFGLQLRLGLDLIYTAHGRLGIEFRDIMTDASFSGVSNGSADVGGKIFLLTVKIGV
jgi:opacity protein-like surface antigen